MGVSVAGPRFRPTSRPSRMFCDHRARNRHSDNEKFCNDLNRPKTSKMSELPLKTLQFFETSKLNTRARFPSPAPNGFHGANSDVYPKAGIRTGLTTLPFFGCS